jgi:anti-anti-sigma factor
MTTCAERPATRKVKDKTEMSAVGSSFFTVPERPGWAGPEADFTIVWLRGDHDKSTDKALCVTLACAIALGCSLIVVDLSEVSFMGASTFRVIARAREFCRLRERSLRLRSPSDRAQRTIDACGLADGRGMSLADAVMPSDPAKGADFEDEKTEVQVQHQQHYSAVAAEPG